MTKIKDLNGAPVRRAKGMAKAAPLQNTVQSDFFRSLSYRLCDSFARGTPMKRCLISLIVAIALLSLMAAAQAQSASAPYKNPSLAFDERVKDLLGRMTLEEKVAQMVSTWQSHGSHVSEQTYVVSADGKIDMEKAKAMLKHGLGEFSRPSEALSGVSHPHNATPAAMAEFTNQ